MLLVVQQFGVTIRKWCKVSSERTFSRCDLLLLTAIQSCSASTLLMARPRTQALFVCKLAQVRKIDILQWKWLMFGNAQPVQSVGRVEFASHRQPCSCVSPVQAAGQNGHLSTWMGRSWKRYQ